jgi:phage-related protein
MANKQAIKVFQGKNTALARIGVQLPKITKAEDALRASGKKYTAQEMAAAKAADEKATALADVRVATDKYKGSTEAYSKTLGGELEITENRIKNLLDQLGAKLLPVLTSVFGFMASHTNVLIAVGAAITAIWAACVAVTAVTKAWAAATKIATAVQWLWNAAMDANPIGLVVIALAALVAGVILAYKHFSTFREIVIGVGRREGGRDQVYASDRGRAARSRERRLGGRRRDRRHYSRPMVEYLERR